MILEQLISAYLDGELSQEQDAELRSMISSDPAAREAFDSSVLIHIAMRCEDDTIVPRDLRLGVFDAVDAFAKNNVVPKRSLRRSALMRSAATVAVLLAIVCFPISESYLQRTLDVVENDTPLSAPVGISADTVKKVVGAEELNNDASIASITDVASNADEQPIPVEERFQTPPPTESAGIHTLSSVFASSTSFNVGANFSNPEPGTPQLPLASATRVTVSTMYAAGSDMQNIGASNIRQFSASIGYGVAESDFVGLEVGSTTYSIDQQTTVLHTNGSYTSMAIAPPDGNGVPGKLASPDHGTSGYSSSSVVLTSSQSSAWGSAFYERRILEQKDLSFNARAGAGFGEDGALGYGRLMGEWHVGGIVSIVIGGEVRLMPFRTGTEPNKITSTTYGTAITGLTGLHLRF